MTRNLFLLSMVSVMLAGCGIKPKTIEPPEGSSGTTYPATYPKLDVDS